MLGIYSCGEECDPDREYVGKDYRAFCFTPAWDLVKAIQYGNLKVAEELIRSSPDLVNYQHSEYGNSLLFWATLNSNSKAINLLLQNGAKVEELNGKNTSPVELASFNYTDCESRILDSLIHYLPKGTEKSQSILNRSIIGAASQPCLRKVKLLISNGASPNFLQTKSHDVKVSALSEAVIQGQYENLDFFLSTDDIELSSGKFTRADGTTVTLKQMLLEHLEDDWRDQEEIRPKITALVAKIDRISSRSK